MSKSTKDEILKTLTELLESKPLDDITVTELVERCGISRQAFYYHFSDLYGVVDYAAECMMDELRHVQPGHWREAIEQLLMKIQEKRTLLLNVYRAYERSYVEYNLRQWISPLIEVKVQETAQRHRVSEAQMTFVVDFCSQGLVGILLGWIERGMPAGLSDRMDDFYCIIEGSLDYMLERLAQRNQ